MQQELDRLRSQTERNAHRFVQMWTGKSVEAAFGGWVTVVAQSKLTRAKAERFAAVRTTRGVRRVLRAFRENVDGEAHTRAMLARVRARWQNSHLFHMFAVWTEHVRKIKHERTLLKRFRLRFSNMACARAYTTWIAMVAERKRVRHTITSSLHRMQHGKVRPRAGARARARAGRASRDSEAPKLWPACRGDDDVGRVCSRRARGGERQVPARGEAQGVHETLTRAVGETPTGPGVLVDAHSDRVHED